MPPPPRSQTGPESVLSSEEEPMQSPDSTHSPTVEKTSSLDSPLSDCRSAWGVQKRRWIPKPDKPKPDDPKPDDPKRGYARNLIICFDGTGDQFDNDVCSPPSTSEASSHSYPS
jgi:hypothetical protein